MIYLDASVALAHLLAEDRCPPTSIWQEILVSSRLLEYELWTVIHTKDLGPAHGDQVRGLLARVDRVEMTEEVLERSLAPFPRPVRTLEALHLSTAAWLRNRVPGLTVATYDTRMAEAAGAMGLELAEI